MTLASPIYFLPSLTSYAAIAISAIQRDHCLVHPRNSRESPPNQYRNRHPQVPTNPPSARGISCGHKTTFPVMPANHRIENGAFSVYRHAGWNSKSTYTQLGPTSQFVNSSGCSSVENVLLTAPVRISNSSIGSWRGGGAALGKLLWPAVVEVVLGLKRLAGTDSEAKK